MIAQIDWFTAWPSDALLTVATSFFQDINMSDEVRSSVLKLCSIFQESVAELSARFQREAKRMNYVTPTSYLELLNAFRALLDVKRAEVSAAKSRYDVGLQKLSDTAASVAGMQAELQDLQPKLVVARKEADELMAKIAIDSKEAAATKEVVDRDAAAANVMAEEAMAIKYACYGRLLARWVARVSFSRRALLTTPSVSPPRHLPGPSCVQGRLRGGPRGSPPRPGCCREGALDAQEERRR